MAQEFVISARAPAMTSATTDGSTAQAPQSEWRQWRDRLGSSAMLILIVLGTMLRLPLWMFVTVTTAITAIALFEFFTIIRQRGILVHRPLGVGLGVVFSLLVAWRALGGPGGLEVPGLTEQATLFNWAWEVFWPVTIVTLFLRQFTRVNTFEALSGLTATLFGLAYIPGLLSYLFYIRAFQGYDGVGLIIFLILVTKMGDVGALIVGRSIGRHTLQARISPRKTIEGLAGAIVVSCLTAVLARGLAGPLGQSLWVTIGCGFFLGVFGQLGDLAESLIKRDCQVKDSSRLFPGLGGMLDIADSLLFTTPLFYAFLIYK